MTGLHDLVHRYPTVKGLRGREGPDVMHFDLDSLRRLPEAKASKKAVFRVRCLRSVSFMGLNGAFVSSLRTTERFHLGKFLELLGRSL